MTYASAQPIFDYACNERRATWGQISSYAILIPCAPVARVWRATARRRRRIVTTGDRAMSGPADQSTGKPVTVTIGRRQFSLPEAEAFCRRYANCFFWIAGLSLLNMFMIATEANYQMLLGL